MAFFEKLIDGAAGGIVGSVTSLIQGFFPPSMTEKEKSEALLAAKDLEHKQNVELLKLGHAVQTEFNDRIKAMEGTAKDLQQFGFLGKIIVFLRGCQRPAFGIGTLVIDIMILLGKVTVTLQTNPQFKDGQWIDGSWTPQGVTLIIMNLLVLTFLFGERALKNVMPIILEFLHTKGLAKNVNQGADKTDG